MHPVRFSEFGDQFIGSIRRSGETLLNDVKVHRVVFGMVAIIAKTKVDEKDGISLGVHANISGRRVAMDDPCIVNLC